MQISRRFAGFTYLYMVLCSLLISILVSLFINIINLTSIWASITICIFSLLLIFLPPFIMLKRYGYPIKETLNINPLSFSQIVLVIILSIAVIIMHGMLKYVITFPLITVLFPPYYWSSFMISKQYPLLYSLLAMSLIPAILNSLIFQGIIQSGLKQLKPYRMCVVIGLLFALTYTDLFNLIPYIFIGFMFSYIVHKSGSVFHGMIMQLLFYIAAYFNLVQYLQNLIYPIFSKVGGTAFLIIISILVGYFVIKGISRHKRTEKVSNDNNINQSIEDNGVKEVKKGQNAGFIAGIAVMASLMLLRAVYTIIVYR